MFFINSFYSALKEHYDNDLIDQANFFYTPVLLIIFSLGLTARSLVGRSIQCWMPANFAYSWQDYVENYCFAHNTYFVKPHENVPSLFERPAKEIGYYKWVPVFLGVEAILFYLPQLIWRTFNWRTGISIKTLVMSSVRAASYGEALRAKEVEKISHHIYRALQIQKNINGYNSVTVATSRGRYVTSLYFLVKGLYVVQAIIHLFVLDRFLSANNIFWGFQIFKDLINGREWQESGHFPRVTLCDFLVSTVGDNHRHTVQCVLRINMYNEKVFLFIWFWLVLLLLVIIVNHIMWTVQMASSRCHVRFLKPYLRVSTNIKDDGDDKKKELVSFAEEGLGDDGILALRLIAGHSDDMITSEIIGKLWELHFLKEDCEPIGFESNEPVEPSTSEMPNDEQVTDGHDEDGTHKLENPPISEDKGSEDEHQSTATLQKTMKSVQDFTIEPKCNTKEILNINDDNNSSAMGQEQGKAADVSDKDEQ